MSFDDDDFVFSLSGTRTRHKVRVGDAEREAAATALHEHYAQGRLRGEELNDRLNAVLTARYIEELRQVTSDLPGHASAAKSRQRERFAPWLILAIVAAAVVGGRGHHHGSMAALLLVAVIAVLAGVLLLRRRA